MDGHSCERLLVDDVLRLDVHPDRLIQVRRAGRIRRLDAERHARQATIPELRERAVQERLRVAAAAVFAPHPEYADIAASVSIRVVPCNGRDLAVASDQEPEAEVQIRVRGVPFPPL